MQQQLAFATSNKTFIDQWHAQTPDSISSIISHNSIKLQQSALFVAGRRSTKIYQIEIRCFTNSKDEPEQIIRLDRLTESSRVSVILVPKLKSRGCGGRDEGKSHLQCDSLGWCDGRQPKWINAKHSITKMNLSVGLFRSSNSSTDRKAEAEMGREPTWLINSYK